jgi:hypothetical protein
LEFGVFLFGVVLVLVLMLVSIGIGHSISAGPFLDAGFSLSLVMLVSGFAL